MATEKRRRNRKGKVERAPYRARAEELLRSEKYTLREIVAIIEQEYPDEKVTVGSIHTFDKRIHDFTERMRELETSARVIAEKYGPNAGDDATTVLANAMVVLATDTVLKLNEKSLADEPVDLAAVRAASQIAKNAQESKRVSLNVRKQIEAEAREALVREQAERLDKVVRTGGLSAESAADFRKKILGIA